MNIKIKKKYFWVLFILLVFSASVYWFSNLIWNIVNNDAICGSNTCVWNDNWNLAWDYTFQSPDWNSLIDWETIARLEWEVVSTLFWDFSFWLSNNDLELIKTSRTDCSEWTTYSISWILESQEAWWNMDFIENESYYCPADWTWYWKLFSDQLWYKEVWNLSWDDLWVTFNLENQLLVKWLLWTEESWTDIDWNIVNDSEGSDIDSQILQISVPKIDIYQNINKNVSILVQNLEPETDSSINSFNSNTYYYNYEGEEGIISNENNKWKIVEINNASDYQVWINWEKNLIIKWWNLYINSDIYNEDSNSILTIVVQRDDTEIKNGWNIYVNPNVTNIDAILIAEWSIINYDWTNVITDDDKLRNQLYIYGSTFTKNSIWTWENPYGSDWYIANPGDLTLLNEKYDFTELRSFNLIVSSTWSTEDCSNWDFDNLLVPRLDNSMAMKEYAWAWKRECYMDDPVKTNLRWIDKFNPLIIEYNPIISTKPPFILQNN